MAQQGQASHAGVRVGITATAATAATATAAATGAGPGTSARGAVGISKGSGLFATWSFLKGATVIELYSDTLYANHTLQCKFAKLKASNGSRATEPACNHYPSEGQHI